MDGLTAAGQCVYLSSMRHLLLFLDLLSLGCGIFLFSVVMHRYRTFRQGHLRTYAVHLACLNLMALANVVLVYITLNISHEKSVISDSLIVPWTAWSVLLYCAMIGFAATFLVLLIELCLQGVRLWQKWMLGLGLTAALVFLAFGLAEMDLLQGSLHYLDYAVRALVLTAAIVLLVQTLKVANTGKRAALRGFAIFYAAVHLLFFLFFALKGRWSGLFAFYWSAYFLCLNLVPLIFLGAFLRFFHGKKLLLQRHLPDQESMLAGYGVSKREMEIVQLVCAGKSNREIEELLFISIKTVKFHLYSIYRKLGVRNRIELANVVQEAMVAHFPASD